MGESEKKKEVTVQDFFCKRGEYTVWGREYRPEGEKLPAVICSHGFGGSGNDFGFYCETFASLGYAAYCLDFCGGGMSSRSSGTMLEMSPLTEEEDLRAVLDYVKSRSYVDTGNIVLLGASQGGLVSALTAAKYADEIKGLVLLFPALCIPDHARAGHLAGASYDVAHVPEVIDGGWLAIGRVYHEAVVNLDVFAELKSYHGPVLIAHGTADAVVDYHYSIRAKETYAPGQCELKLVEGAGHGFSKEQDADVLVAIEAFLETVTSFSRSVTAGL